MVQERRRDLGFGSREKNRFGVWFKREEGIWGLVQERRRDLGVWFSSREKKGFGGFGSKREEGISGKSHCYILVNIF